MSNPAIEILDATPVHVRMLSQKLKTEEISSADALGMTPHAGLWQAYRKSLKKKTAFIDGEIAAMWGVAGVYLGTVGKPWLVLSPAVDEYPFRMIFCYRKELTDMLKLFPKLEEWVDVRNEKSVRLLEIMGFEFDKPIPMGRNGELFMRAEKCA